MIVTKIPIPEISMDTQDISSVRLRSQLKVFENRVVRKTRKT
jgi:hypothetical protein